VEERERLLAEALAHVEERDAQYHVSVEEVERQPVWKPVVAALLLLCASYLAFFPPALLAGAWPQRITVGEETHGVRATLFIQAQQVEAFRLQHGHLPESLAELPVHFPGMELIRSNNRVYQLVAHGPGGGTLVYDSAMPAKAFEALPLAWGLESKAP
jgi:hypothetical protein